MKRVNQGWRIRGETEKAGGDRVFKGKRPEAKVDLGVLGECLCPKCGVKIPSIDGIPCFDMNCPECGTMMVRKLG